MSKPLGYVARESALIIFSILAALGVNEWRMRWAAEEDEREAYAAVYAELSDNLEILEGLPAYHAGIARALRARVEEIAQAGAPDGATPADVFFAMEELRPAIITDRIPQDVSWELAKQRGAAARFDYATARDLSMIYDGQRNGVIVLISDIADLLARPEMYVPDNFTASLSPIAAQFAELSSREETLVYRLEKQVKAMREANPKLAAKAQD